MIPGKFTWHSLRLGSWDTSIQIQDGLDPLTPGCREQQGLRKGGPGFPLLIKNMLSSAQGAAQAVGLRESSLAVFQPPHCLPTRLYCQAPSPLPGFPLLPNESYRVCPCLRLPFSTWQPEQSLKSGNHIMSSPASGIPGASCCS